MRTRLGRERPDSDSRAVQALRRPRSCQGHLARDPRGGDLRPPRPERRRQDHDPVHALNPGRALGRRRRDLRDQPAGRPNGHQAHGGPRAPADQPLPDAERGGEPGVLRAPPRSVARGPGRPDRSLARPGGARAATPRPRRDLLGWHAAPTQPRVQPGSQAPRPVARRAHGRRRSAVARQHLRGRASPLRAGSDRFVHHPLHGGSGAPVRPHRDPRRGSRRRPRNAD